VRKRIARVLAASSTVLARLALRARGWQPIEGAEDKPDPPAKTFTQAEHEAEVNRIVQERLARDRKDRPTDDEIAELRKQAKKAADLEAANLTASEKLKADAEKAQQERDEAKADAQAARDEANKTKLQAKILTAASKAGAIDADAVYALLQNDNFAVTKDGTKIEVTIGDDGQVTGHEEAVTAYLEAKPYLVGTTPTPGPGGGGPRPSTAPALTQEQLAMAKSFDMTPEEYAANM
jgi:Flp pilus assembly protein TadG